MPVSAAAGFLEAAAPQPSAAAVASPPPPPVSPRVVRPAPAGAAAGALRDQLLSSWRQPVVLLFSTGGTGAGGRGTGSCCCCGCILAPGGGSSLLRPPLLMLLLLLLRCEGLRKRGGFSKDEERWKPPAKELKLPLAGGCTRRERRGKDADCHHLGQLRGARVASFAQAKHAFNQFYRPGTQLQHPVTWVTVPCFVLLLSTLNPPTGTSYTVQS